MVRRKPVYFASFGDFEGPTVILEAHPAESEYDYPASQTPDAAAELERLRADGHQVTRAKRAWRITTSLSSVRATQLYRTLPHEVGHHVHYDSEVRQKAGDDVDLYGRLQDLHFTRPAREKEDFAHRYAREFFESRLGRGLPFERIVDPENMKRQGLEPAWFGVNP